MIFAVKYNFFFFINIGMKSILIFSLIFFVLNTSTICSQESNAFNSKYTAEQLNNAPAMLIPFPKNISWENKFLETKKIYVEQIEVLPKSIALEIKSIADFYKIKLTKNEGLNISFKHKKGLSLEEYHITTSESGVLVEAITDAGHFYALQTLRQLIQVKNGKCVIPICEIKDSPAYSIRGYMIDVGRNFQSIASLKKQLDIMAMYKLNVFHWHLTDRPAWRIESKKYPELTDPVNHRPTRDPGKFYSYNDMRELIDYAREKHISIIPEIDMPGHSDSFVKSMGVKMESEKGMEILENILNEFFAEIPKSDCPIIHIGSDEVKINNPDEFISKMVSICKKNGREVMIWNPGLPADNSVIRQTWLSKHLEKAGYREIDSWNNYVNNGEPMTQILRLLFKPVGYPSDNEMMGGILCLWPDVNIANEADVFQQNPLYSSLLTFAWKTWTADINKAPSAYYMTLPPSGSPALKYFSVFEKILVHHKKQFFADEPFQYHIQSDKIWKLIGTFNGDDGDAILEKIKDGYSYNGDNLNWKTAVGNTLVIKDRFKLGGYFPKAEKGQTAYALTYIHSDENKEVDTWIGFETPMRSNRTYTGIPHQGRWDVSGGNIWVNDEPLPPPVWEDAGWRPHKSEGWSPEHQEKSWGKEELYWTRTPSKVPLKKGWNKVFVKIPCSSNYQNWMFTFVPLKMEGLEFSTEPN